MGDIITTTGIEIMTDQTENTGPQIMEITTDLVTETWKDPPGKISHPVIIVQLIETGTTMTLMVEIITGLSTGIMKDQQGNINHREKIVYPTETEILMEIGMGEIIIGEENLIMVMEEIITAVADQRREEKMQMSDAMKTMDQIMEMAAATDRAEGEDNKEVWNSAIVRLYERPSI